MKHSDEASGARPGAAPFTALAAGGAAPRPPAPKTARRDRGRERDFRGGKSSDGVWQTIVNLIPPHRVFIEPFAGEAAIARKLRPGAEIILVDRVRQPGLELPQGARFILGDGIAFVKNYRFTGDEFIYADPPYLLDARRDRTIYTHEMSEEDHRRLLRVLKSVNCRVLLSGYRSPLYDRELAGWGREEFQARTLGSTVTEVLWFNYPRPGVLHDYQCVGAEYRARQRLRKKIKRAVVDLAAMPALERGAMLAKMIEALSAEEVAAALAAARQGTLEVCTTRDPRARNGAGVPRAGIGAARDRHVVAPELLRAFRESLAIMASGAAFDAASTIAGSVAEGGRPFVVRVEVRRPGSSPAVAPKMARAAAAQIPRGKAPAGRARNGAGARLAGGAIPCVLSGGGGQPSARRPDRGD